MKPISLHKTAILFVIALFSLCLINSPAIAGWQTQTVDPTGFVGGLTSLAFDSSGSPAISYYDLTNSDLKFARFVPNATTATTTTTTTSTPVTTCPFPGTYYFDMDGDGYGDPNNCVFSCFLIPPLVSNPSDCDDTDPHVNPGAFEVCNDGKDNDCDGFVDCDDGDCAGVLSCLCQCLPSSLEGCVSGRVTNSAGEPLAGKTVIFRGRVVPGGPRIRMNTRTNDDGCYQFNLSEGTGIVKVRRCIGGGSKSVSVPVGGKVNDVNFVCR